LQPAGIVPAGFLLGLNPILPPPIGLQVVNLSREPLPQQTRPISLES